MLKRTTLVLGMSLFLLSGIFAASFSSQAATELDVLATPTPTVSPSVSPTASPAEPVPSPTAPSPSPSPSPAI